MGSMKRPHDGARCRDRIVIDVGGKSFTTSRTTLVACDYFRSMFQFEENYCQDDPMFLDRDPELFSHVLSFLRSRKIPHLPSFSNDPALWRALREEAVFYGCAELHHFLMSTHKCEFKWTGDKNGVLYWLGCGKGKHTYENPYQINAVMVASKIDGVAQVDPKTGNVADHPVTFDESEFCFVCDGARAAFVQHAPSYKLMAWDTIPECDNKGIVGRPVLCRCMQHVGITNWSSHAEWASIDLGNVLLCPTHYSMSPAPLDGCPGMKAWYFGASEDGMTWECLHEAHDKDLRFNENDVRAIAEETGADLEDKDFLDAVAITLARRHTKTFAIDNVTKYYRYFRISSMGSDEGVCCLHAQGLELYGDLHEE
eukprot:CAMPEP_0119303986 /NCGR_PEP_ID=MMETSP1333-20130426/5321_1 /TAXON_ID=418940 /ORGANISM="Scyphosphaera apsteinii, Strain RCC1455" /LENGTH=368 /DNA_ID=CAMNT_0007306783 /DNA_START=44 /DNA_END=1150 /DNA_ORIENTATION=+